MEVRWRMRGFRYADRGRKRAVERTKQIRRRDVGLESDGRNLRQRVHAGVGTARALRKRALAGVLTTDTFEGGGQFALNGSEAGLHLPAVEIRAVVSENELPHLRIR